MTEKRFNARKNIDNDFEERLKVELEDIVGIVHSDDVTNSVELKKEYYKSRMTENKRYYLGNGKLLTVCDSNKGGSDGVNGLTQYEVVDLLNEQEELIQRLKTIREEQTETILKQKRKIRELEERNKRQYNRLKEITDLMTKRDWKTLEQIADEWEKQEKLLNQEWGTYCGDKE